MSAKAKAGEGVAFGIAVAAVLGVGGYFGWRWLQPQIVGLAGAAGAEAGAQASSQLESAAPTIGTQVGTAAGPAAVQSAKETIKGEIFGEPTTFGESGPTVLVGGVPVEVT